MTDYATHIERDGHGRAAAEPDDAGIVAAPSSGVTPQPDALPGLFARCPCGQYFQDAPGKQFCSRRCKDRAYNTTHPVARRVYHQPALPGHSRVERRFAEWIESPAGRYVEAEVLRLALEDLADGYRRGEINLYLALVRRASRHLTKDRAGYACNQNHRAYLARRLMAGHLELAGFFQTRALQGVA